MFDRIAPVYDAMNRVMTAGLDRRWRRLAAEAVVRPGDRVLDACCGTGDLALAAPRARRRRHRARLLAADARAGAPQGGRTIEWVEGDLLALPFADASFDAATVGFGVRNVADLDAGAARAAPRARARRPARRSSRSRSRAARCARSSGSGSTASSRCSARVLPGGAAYTYLPASVRRFPGPDELAALLDATPASATSASGCSPAAIVALHTGAARVNALADDPRGARARGLPRRARGAARAQAVARHPGRRRGGRRRRRSPPAASGCGRCSSSSPPRPGSEPSARGRRRGRARAHGDARPRRPDRRRASSAAAAPPPGRRTARRRRRRPATTSSPARSPSWPRPATRQAVAMLADAASALARGEALQRSQTHDPATTVDAYLERCALKTGKLFEAACRLGGGSRRRSGSRSASRSRSPTTSSTAPAQTIETGKIAGTDLREGTPTLPLLLAAQRGRGRARARSPAGRSTARSCGSPRPARSSARARSRSTTLGEARACLDGEPHREELEA